MIGVLAVAAGLACVVASVGAAATSAARAQGAADASALAAAAAARDQRALGEASRDRGAAPCARARAVTVEWDATLASCTLDGTGAASVTVTVHSTLGDATRRSRAGTR